jgi:hypothetical protein
MPVIAALVVAAAVLAAAFRIAAAIEGARAERTRGRVLELIAAFAPAVGAAQADTRAILVWHPLARTARALFPDEFAQIDAAAGGQFPFSKEQLQAAHARWTAEWLAWEKAHDSEYKLKAAAAEHDLAVAGPSPVLRARVDAVEQEKLERYQRRYEEYVRVAKALQALV